MTKTYCDFCGNELQDGPVGSYYNVTIDFQPAYLPAEKCIKLHLCREDEVKLEMLIDSHTAF